MAMIPHRTTSSIKKYLIEGQAKAGIQMTFPLRPTQLPCSITFQIEGNIIEDIASALVGVVVKFDEEIRYLYYPGGTEVFAYEGRFKLRNGKVQVMAELFGPEIATAVRTSPIFQQGMNEPDRTKCINVSVQNTTGNPTKRNEVIDLTDPSDVSSDDDEEGREEDACHLHDSYDSHNCTIIGKRKRDASVNTAGRKRGSGASSKMSKKRSANAEYDPKQRERCFSLRSPQSPPGSWSRADVAEVKENQDTGAKSSSLGRTKKNYGSASKDTEYEVERILAVRIHRSKLQHRVKWLDYKADPHWYTASNFKNSPHKLRAFHEVNPTITQPPRGLDHWQWCWEEDRDADDYTDDDKPMRTAREGEKHMEQISSFPK
ncbi:hypothetical protein PMIN01_08061 [Paraphaeosphaeria minitans]|uniref:Chromo domain-containing protein n=1 Tax=Paraphaeosphaeria minitans TaxID=565426 RepID=A0A9P6KNL0_9PLEO|nr:hypothetical protein PMIN01_08061 [Paraphaeosphaeria minitans]